MLGKKKLEDKMEGKKKMRKGIYNFSLVWLFMENLKGKNKKFIFLCLVNHGKVKEK